MKKGKRGTVKKRQMVTITPQPRKKRTKKTPKKRRARPTKKKKKRASHKNPIKKRRKGNPNSLVRKRLKELTRRHKGKKVVKSRGGGINKIRHKHAKVTEDLFGNL
jgi:hypothetical protein